MSDDSFSGDHSLSADHELPCGHTVGDLLTLLSEGASPELTEHARTCQWCQAELVELKRAWEPVRHSARLAVEPPDGLVERSLMTVRGIRGGLRSEPVAMHQDGGTLRIPPQALIIFTRLLCAEILTDYPGVHLRGCGGDAAELRVDLAVRYPLHAAELTSTIQAELSRGLQDALGPMAPSIWVLVVDVLPPESR